MIDKVRNINSDDFYKLYRPEEKIKFLLQYAILAPSTHNSQPWLFKIKEGFCEVYYDKNLRLPYADPEGRDLFISVGCAIENLIIASKYLDVFESIAFDHYVDDNPIAIVKFKNLNTKKLQPNLNFKPLTETILKRINARGIFQNKKVDQEIINSILSRIKNDNYLLDQIDVKFINSKEKIKKIASLTAQGIQKAYKDPLFRKEMSKWLHNSMTSKKEGLPGYALKVSMILSFILPTLVRFKDLGNLLGKLNKKSINSAPLVCIINTSNENPYTWLQVGRLAERLMLEFNKHLYQTSIFVAAIEMGDSQKEVQNLLKTNKKPQFLFVVGQIDSLHRKTPRVPLKAKLIS
jgi:hypothetical protein